MNGITVQAGEGMMFSFKEKNISTDIKWAFQHAKAGARLIHRSRPCHVAYFDASAKNRLL
jgi:hypothetical protein